jgi:hypothetical protein
MRALRIESGGKLFIDGEYADLAKLDNKGEFLASVLMLDVELGENVNCVDLIHLFYDAKDLIQNILSEEYEVVRALVSASPLPRDYKAIRIYKSFKIEEELQENKEFIYMSPEIEMVKAEFGENGVKNVAGLSVYIDETIKLIHNDVVIESNAKLSLLDVLTCLFDELPSLIKSGALLLPQ